MSHMIDLRSDTVTKPTNDMKTFMMNAEVGDDVFEDDPTVKQLEEIAANMFGKEAGLFCPSGTMTNQIALMTHLKPGDEVICSRESHIYNYEGGGIARNAGASVRLIERKSGLLELDDVVHNINPDDVHLPVTKLVALENTCNRGGGNCYDLKAINEIKTYCDQINLPLHLDGARLFNAIVKTEVSSQTMGSFFDSISICLSKGLGTPLGSVLLGSHSFIKQARRNRKVLGGGMRQVGIVAAAGIYALENNITRLREDHLNAQSLANGLNEINGLSVDLKRVQTNIVNVLTESPANDWVKKLYNFNVLCFAISENCFRMVTHLNISKTDINKTIEITAKAF